MTMGKVEFRELTKSVVSTFHFSSVDINEAFVFMVQNGMSPCDAVIAVCHDQALRIDAVRTANKKKLVRREKFQENCPHTETIVISHEECKCKRCGSYIFTPNI